MNLSLLLANQITVMGGMILLGFLASKAKLVTLADSNGMSKACLYIVSPCMLIAAFQTEFSKEKAWGYLLALGASVVFHIIYIIVAKLLAPVFHMSLVEQVSIIYTNCGNLIIPIIYYVLGPEYVLYTCAYLTVQTVLMWTHCVTKLSGESRINLRKIIANPNIIAIVLGLIMFFGKVAIPEIPLSALQRVGDCIGPISMMVIGIMLGEANLKMVFGNSRTWLVSGLRLIICPIAVLLAIWASHASKLMPGAENILFIVFIASAAPSASTVSQMANIFHRDEIHAGCINMMTVLLCMISMPIMTFLYQNLCM